MSGCRRFFNPFIGKFACCFSVFLLLAAPATAGKHFVHPRLIIVQDEKTAEEILTALKGGKSFALLAKERSLDEKSRDRYGDLGEIPIENLDAPLRKVAGELNDGEVSGVVALEGGRYALLQIVDLSFYRKGAHAFRSGDFRTAETDLLKHIGANPDAVKGRIMLGKIYEKRKDTKNAERLFTEALVYDPLNEEAYDRLGSIYTAAGEYGKAAAVYKKGLDHVPDAELLKLGLKVASGHITPVAEARAEKTVFLRVILTKSEADANDILSAIRKGKTFASLAKARSIDDKSRNAFGYLGEVEVQTLDKPVQEALTHLKSGETSGVIPLDDKRYALVQKTDIRYFTEGEKAFVSGDKKNAERNLLKHVELNPDSVRALTMLGMIYEEEKKSDKAEEMYRQAISYDPSAVLVYERLGRMYLLAGQFKKAKELYQDGLKHVPSSAVLGEGLEMTDILLINRGAGVP
jgi:parvulin-like peptidyl-prolyl isomerase